MTHTRTDASERVAESPGLFDALRLRFPELSAGQRQVAEFLLAHSADAAFLSAAAIGARVGVSESTVVRLASRAGYHGYPELQQRLRNELKERLSPQARMASTLRAVDAASVYQRAFGQDLANIVRARDGLSGDRLQEVVERLRKARINYAIGMRSSLAVAHLYVFFVNQVLRNARLLDGAADQIGDQLAGISPRDTLLAVGFPRYSRRSREVLRFAKRRGAFVVVVTDSPVSPLGLEGDVVLPAPCDALGFPISIVAAVSVVNALVAGLAFTEGKRALRRLAELDRANRELRVMLAKMEEPDG
jgi:DNA-binding MurR/RpiR family transcriptional regulator